MIFGVPLKPVKRGYQLKSRSLVQQKGLPFVSTANLSECFEHGGSEQPCRFLRETGGVVPLQPLYHSCWVRGYIQHQPDLQGNAPKTSWVFPNKSFHLGELIDMALRLRHVIPRFLEPLICPESKLLEGFAKFRLGLIPSTPSFGQPSG